MPPLDTSLPAPERARQFFALCTKTLESHDPLENNIPATSRFLFHVAWHEGARLTTRRQWRHGPARSFFQIEPARCREALIDAERKNYLAALGALAGTTKALLSSAGAALPLTGTEWPSSSPIEHLLLENDEFAILLVRVAFRRIPEKIPTLRELEAQYWATHWKRAFTSEADRDRLIATFRAESQEADAYLPRSVEF